MKDGTHRKFAVVVDGATGRSERSTGREACAEKRASAHDRLHKRNATQHFEGGCQ